MVAIKIHRAPETSADLVRRPRHAELMERFVCQKDSAALAALVDCFGGMVWGICRRLLHTDEDAEDAFQAVFLVLLKKGATIRNKEAVGSWLYGVAYRTAMKARRDLAHRKKLESKAAPPAPPPSPTGVASCRELQRLLDEEVNRLPDKLKAPFVLCCIEGLSKSEAAQELRWKEGTVSGRLARARKHLQQRLTRRGITLSAALTVLALTKESAAAAVPPLLAKTTITGLSAAVGGKTAAALSPAAVTLAEGVGRALAVAKVKMMATAVLAMSLAVGGAAVATNQLGQVPQPRIVPPPVPKRSVTFVAPPVPFLDFVDEEVMSVAFSPDGERLVTAGGRHVFPGQIKVWDVASRRELQKLRMIKGTRCVAFAPDGQILACGEFGGAITLRDAKTSQPRAVLRGHTIGVNGLAFSPDGAWLISAGLDHAVKLWDMKTRAERQAFVGHTAAVFGVAFFHDGKTFVSAGIDKSTRVWDVGQGKEKFILWGHDGAVEHVAVSPDDKIIATASWDRTIRLWNAETGVEIAVLTGHQAPVFSVAFSSDGAWLASGSGDGEVRLWDAKKHRLVATLGRHDSEALSVAFSPNDKLLASGSADGTARLWDVATKKEIGKLKASELWPVTAMAYAPDGKTVAIATDDRNISLYDATTATKRTVLSGHAGRVTCVAYSPDGLTLASGSFDKTVRLWDARTGVQRRVLEHTGSVYALAFAADGRLASAGQDAAVRIWDPGTGARLRTRAGHRGPVYSLAFARPSGILASGGADGIIRLWDDDQTNNPGKLEGHQGTVRALTFAGETLISGSDDSTVKVWEPPADGAGLTAPRTPRTLIGHAGAVRALAYLDGADGFVSAGSNGDMIQWKLNGKQPLDLLPYLGKPVSSLAIQPAGQELLSGGLDGKVLRWRAGKLGGMAAQAAPFREGKANPPRAAAPRPELKEFYQDLRGSKSPQAPLQLFGVKAAQVTHEEDRGLHVKVVANPEQTQRVGLNLPARFRGDFEVTAAYEIVSAEIPEKGHGVGVTLIVDLDAPDKDVLELMRAARANEGQVYGITRVTMEDGKDKYHHEWYPTTSKAGHLRLTRRGSVLTYSVREGGSQEFHELSRLTCGTYDIKGILFVAYMGYAPNSVDVYLKDLSVAPPGAGHLAVMDPSEPKTEAAASPTRNRFYLIFVGLFLMLLLMAAAFSLAFARRRKRRETEEEKPAAPVPETVPVAVFVCSQCGARLRTQQSIAGKRVKCPRCGNKIDLPQASATGIKAAE